METKYDEEQSVLMLCFLSYLGFDELTPGVKGDEHVERLIREALDFIPGFDKRWELAWGPVSRRFAFTIFAQNLMFVVRDRRDPTQLVVVIRGTNPVSPTNWLVEDFSIARMVRWPYFHGDDVDPPEVSMGTLIGLKELQSMRPVAGVPGDGRSLTEFLGDELRARPGAKFRVSVAGHSLGGALAPAAGLWLEDTRRFSDVPDAPPWDPEGRAAVHVHSYAGPTPGNRAFAAHYDDKLGARTHRVWNPLDVVPYGWEREKVEKLSSLYQPSMPAGLILDFIFWLTGRLSANGNYRHVLSTAPASQGAKLHPVFSRFWMQMLYQHSLAYLEIFDLLGHIQIAEHLPFGPWMHREVTQIERGAAGLERQLEALPTTKLAGRISHAVARLVHVPASLFVHALPAHLPLASLMQRRDHHAAQVASTDLTREAPARVAAPRAA